MAGATVPPHEAFVQGVEVPVVVTLNDPQDAPGVELTDLNGDYTFAPVSQAATTITLQFHPTQVGKSGAKLTVGGTEVPLNGQGKFPIEFESDQVNLGDVLIQASGAGGFVAKNHTVKSVQLKLEGADSSAFQLSPAQLPAFGFPVFVRVDFTPNAARSFSATVTSDFAGSGGPTLVLQGNGVTQTDDGFIQQGFDPGDDGIPTPDDATRFSVFVPRHESHFNMGTPDARTGGVKVEGIGLQTDRDILFAALGEERTVAEAGKEKTFQVSRLGAVATGDVVVQSTTKDVFTLGKERNIMASSGSSFVVANDGIFIATLTGDELGKPEQNTGFPVPTVDNDGAPATTTAASNASKAFSSFDAILAGAVTYVNFQRRRFATTWSSKVSSSLGIVAGVAAFGTAAAAGTGAVPGVVIYGHAGVLLGTGGFGSFYAAVGMVLSSAMPLVLGVETEVVALDSLSMWAGNETSLSGVHANVIHSHRKVSIVADGETPGWPVSIERGDVEIQAKHQVRTATLAGGYEMVIEPDRTRIGLPVAGPARNPAVPLPPAALPGSLELGDRLVQFTVAGVSVALTDTTLTLSDGQGTVVLNAGGITMTGANQETATLAAGNITFNARAANSQINLDSRQINLRAGQNATTPTAQFTLTQIAGGTAELQGTRILLG